MNFSKYTPNGPSILANASLVVLILVKRRLEMTRILISQQFLEPAKTAASHRAAFKHAGPRETSAF